MQEKEYNETIFKEIEVEAKKLWNSMDSFYNPWSKIHEGCEKNNIVESFEEWDSLHIAIYNNWKEKSDTCKQFQQSLKIILKELNLAKEIETFDMDAIEEISEEVKKCSKATETLLDDKYCIEKLTTKIIDIVNEKLPKQCLVVTRAVSRGKNIFMKLYTKISEIIANFIMDASTEGEVRTKKVDNEVDGLTELAQDLSKLSAFLILMNVSFKDLGDLINGAIQSISVGNINTEAQIRSLISITQKLQEIFDTTYRKASKYERITRMLVLKSNPRFLVNQ